MSMTRRVAVVAALSALVGAAIPAHEAVARLDRQPGLMVWLPQSGSSGAVDGAEAVIVRRPNGISFVVGTDHLEPGHAYTAWFIVINNPSACASTPCAPPDILLNPATDAQVAYATGHIVGGRGKATFAAAFRVGPIAGWLPGGRLLEPVSAEIQVVLNDHGPKIPELMPGMIHTYRTGCTDASLPAIFPASAKADGEPGPNACRLYQAAIFAGS